MKGYTTPYARWLALAFALFNWLFNPTVTDDNIKKLLQVVNLKQFVKKMSTIKN